MFLYIVWKEEQFEYEEDDEEFHGDDEPQCAPERHVAETVVIEMPYFTPQFHAANIEKLFEIRITRYYFFSIFAFEFEKTYDERIDVSDVG